MLGSRPLTLARTRSVPVLAPAVAPAVQSPRGFLTWTVKPVSFEELSVHLTTALVDPSAFTRTALGAPGPPRTSMAATLLGLERPLAFLAKTRNS